MPTITPEIILKRTASLPEKVRRILFSADTAKTIETIGHQYKLMIDQIGDAADETGLVIMGFNSPKNLAANLAKKLAIDHSAAEQIAAEINTQIFSKIREELQKLNNESAGAPATPEPKPYTPPAVLPPATIPVLVPQTPAAPKIEVTPFEHKLAEDGIFRAPAVVSEHEAPPAIPKPTESAPLPAKPPLPTKTEIKYGGKDPYKEPIE